jgi:hypothetical protein
MTAGGLSGGTFDWTIDLRGVSLTVESFGPMEASLAIVYGRLGDTGVCNVMGDSRKRGDAKALSFCAADTSERLFMLLVTFSALPVRGISGQSAGWNLNGTTPRMDGLPMHASQYNILGMHAGR